MPHAREALSAAEAPWHRECPPRSPHAARALDVALRVWSSRSLHCGSPCLQSTYSTCMLASAPWGVSHHSCCQLDPLHSSTHHAMTSCCVGTLRTITLLSNTTARVVVFSSHLAHSAQLGSEAGPAWPRVSKPEQTYGNCKTEQTNNYSHPLKGHTRRNGTFLFSSA